MESIQSEMSVQKYTNHLWNPWSLYLQRSLIIACCCCGKRQGTPIWHDMISGPYKIGVMMLDSKREAIDWAPEDSIVRDRWRRACHVCKCNKFEVPHLTWHDKWAFCMRCKLLHNSTTWTSQSHQHICPGCDMNPKSDAPYKKIVSIMPASECYLRQYFSKKMGGESSRMGR